MIWFTSDTHFYHPNVLRFCNRPFKDVVEMNERLIENWNMKVDKRDHIYILGDFCFRGVTIVADLVKRLRGRKILILGNHDHAAHKMVRAGFDEVYENHRISIGNQPIFLSHYPYYPPWWIRLKNSILYGKYDARYAHKRMINQGEWLLHGHCHTYYLKLGKQINVGCDVWNYSPVSHKTILQIIEKEKRNFIKK